MSQANQDRARVLREFHGAVDLDVLRAMMQWEEKDIASLADELIETGLATPNPYSHLTLNSALCPYLRRRMDPEERQALTARWVEAMRSYVKFLDQQIQDAGVAATLTVLELPNLFPLLDLMQRDGDAEATINLATSLYQLLQNLGKPRLLERIGQVRDAAAVVLGDAWNHAQFSAARIRVEQQLATGRARDALMSAQQLLRYAQVAGEEAYPNADYDLALASLLLARVLHTVGLSEQTLALIDEAHQRFEAIAKVRPGLGAEEMVSICFSEKGDSLVDVGRLDEAATAYEISIRQADEIGDTRQVAVGEAQLGTVRMLQGYHPEALAAFEEARKRFTLLDEPGTVAVSWHQSGVVYQHAGEPEAAEDAYRKSLAIEVQLGNITGQARTLTQLGNLYKDVLGRLEEAAAFYKQAVNKSIESGDVLKEAIRRNNLADTLTKLKRFDEAREEVLLAIECKSQFGHASKRWISWALLAAIETKAGNPVASAEAKRKAIACYLSYRRDGGENRAASGRISLAVIECLLAGDAAGAASGLKQLAADADLPSHERTFIDTLQAIVAGSRDRRLADAPNLDYKMAAEILVLIETLEKRG